MDKTALAESDLGPNKPPDLGSVLGSRPFISWDRARYAAT